MSVDLVLDPGHGGADPGAVGGGYQEKDLTLRQVLKLGAILEKAGINVLYTRKDDSLPSLSQRCQMANNAGAAYYVSWHINAGGGVGSEVYCWPGGRGQVLAQKLADGLAPIMGIHGEAVKDAGPKGRNFAVIVGTKMPAALVEVGFIDSPDLQKILNNEDRIIQAAARVLCNWFGKQMPEEHAEPAPVVVAPPAPQTPAVDLSGIEGEINSLKTVIGDLAARVKALEDKPAADLQAVEKEVIHEIGEALTKE